MSTNSQSQDEATASIKKVAGTVGNKLRKVAVEAKKVASIVGKKLSKFAVDCDNKQPEQERDQIDYAAVRQYWIFFQVRAVGDPHISIWLPYFKVSANRLPFNFRVLRHCLDEQLPLEESSIARYYFNLPDHGPLAVTDENSWDVVSYLQGRGLGRGTYNDQYKLELLVERDDLSEQETESSSLTDD